MVKLSTVIDGPGPVKVIVLGVMRMRTRWVATPIPAKRAVWNPVPFRTTPPVAVRTLVGDSVTVPAVVPEIMLPKSRFST